jgi:hypothetical protein
MYIPDANAPQRYYVQTAANKKAAQRAAFGGLLRRSLTP